MSNHKKKRNNIAIVLRDKFKSSFVSKITSVEVLYFLLGSVTVDKFITLYQIREVLSYGIVVAVAINIVLSLYVLWRFRKILERRRFVQCECQSESEPRANLILSHSINSML